MSDENKSTETNKNVDEELSQLLDSALEDFNKTQNSNEKSDNTSNKADDKTTVDNKSKVSNENPLEWSDEFIQQAASQFEANFANLLSSVEPNMQMTPDFMKQKLQQMADAAQRVLDNPAQVTDNSNDFASTISQTIQGLSEGAEGLQNPFTDEDFLKVLGGSGPGQENDLFPFMQGMMQGLLSKEVLGPSLKDFIGRLPEYIEKNRATLPPEDVERYENQRKLMIEVTEELDKEKETDTQEEKGNRFSKVLGLMQKLQDYGQPPTELVGDIETPFSFDPQGNPTNLNPECSVM